jgi:long-chain acyl-CoA synthetase
VYYVKNLQDLPVAIREIKPHGFAAVPRVIEKIYDRFVIKGGNRKFPMKGIFSWALRQGHKFDIGKDKDWYYKVKLRLAYILVLQRLKMALGGKVKFIACASAALNSRLTRIFWAAKIPVLEAYGLTETSPGVTCFRFTPGGVKFGTVGPLLKDVSVRIAEDGEILVKGPNIMLGYYNRPEKTREVIDPDGWFHTGDIGIMEEEKYLKITDRKKEIFKTSSGKYVAPQVIEQKLKESPFIEHIMVIGENRPYTAALIIPNFEYLRDWCARKHIDFISKEKAILNTSVINRLNREVERFNQDLGQTEKIKKFRLLAAEWTQDSGEFSPTLKLRRKYVLEKYSRIIEETYSSGRISL